MLSTADDAANAIGILKKALKIRTSNWLGLEVRDIGYGNRSRNHILLQCKTPMPSEIPYIEDLEAKRSSLADLFKEKLDLVSFRCCSAAHIGTAYNLLGQGRPLSPFS